jgi:hypothetical protein
MYKTQTTPPTPVLEVGEWILYKEMLTEYFKLCKVMDDNKNVKFTG